MRASFNINEGLLWRCTEAVCVSENLALPGLAQLAKQISGPKNNRQLLRAASTSWNQVGLLHSWTFL